MTPTPTATVLSDVLDLAFRFERESKDFAASYHARPGGVGSPDPLSLGTIADERHDFAGALYELLVDHAPDLATKFLEESR